jgi:hypothetical protein
MSKILGIFNKDLTVSVGRETNHPTQAAAVKAGRAGAEKLTAFH